MASPISRPFHGEFSASDGSAGTLTTESSRRLTLYEFGTLTPIVLGASEQVVITDISHYASNASTVLSIYDGADVTIDAGELISKRAGSANYPSNLVTPHFCQAGTYPKAVNSVNGQLDVLVNGHIVRQAGYSPQH